MEKLKKIFQIALVPGDGIGPEVLREGKKVLETAISMLSDGPEFVFREYEAGATCHQKHGIAVPEETFNGLKQADAIFWGCTGLPDMVHPDGTETGPDAGLGLRFRLDLYANVRPIKLYQGVPTVLSNKTAADIDFVIIRENIEGLYAARGGGNILQDSIATDTMVITRRETERISNYAFKLAKKRNGAPKDGRHRVTCVDKANILRTYSFFRRVFSETGNRYPDIDKDFAYVDAMTLWMVQQPDFYDVVVTENMFGDIISDLGAGIAGGMGMAPSAEIGEVHALFQGSHGSAPTIAGKNLANPIATILSGKMLLEWLGEKHNNGQLIEAANKIEASVSETLCQKNIKTKDIGGQASTEEMGDTISQILTDLD